MGKKALLSRASIIAPFDEDFIDEKILCFEEICSFDNEEIKPLKENEAFPSGTFFKYFDALVQPNFISPSWLSFPEYHFSLGLTYPILVLFPNYLRSPKFPTSRLCQ